MIYSFEILHYRKHRYDKIPNKYTLSYFHGVLFAVYALTFPAQGDFGAP